MSIRRNFLFSAILTTSHYVFPFIIYPYIARVLGVENIGICNYVDSIINYASLISMMGIGVVGTRAIAQSRGDRERLDRVFSSLLAVSVVFTLLATGALVTVTYTVEAMEPYRKLLMTGILKLWGNFLILDWLYRGLEDFKYITFRTIWVKVGYMASIFLFVRNEGDYAIYFMLFCLSFAVNAAFSCWRAARMLRFRPRWFEMKKLVGPVVMFGTYIFLNSMYTTFNVTWLGIEKGDTEVGYYTTMTKIFQIVLSIYTAYTCVVMPRASVLLSEHKHDEFRQLMLKSVSGLLMFSVPVMLFTVIYSEGIVGLIAGEGYGGAVVPLRIAAPLFFIIGYEQILIIQTLIPLSKDRSVLFNACVGASIGVAGNLIVVGNSAAVGSSAVWLSAELAVMVGAQVLVKKYIGAGFPWRRFALNFAAYLPYAAIALGVTLAAWMEPVVSMMAGAAFLGIYFIVVQRYVLKNEIFVMMSDKLLHRLVRRGRQ